MSYVKELNSKFHYAQDDETLQDQSSLGLTPSETVAGQQLMPELERLRIKAITKVPSPFILHLPSDCTRRLESPLSASRRLRLLNLTTYPVLVLLPWMPRPESICCTK